MWSPFPHSLLSPCLHNLMRSPFPRCRQCSSLVPTNCEGGFRIGGNCNQQQRLDITRLPQQEFQMGADQVR